MVRVHSFLVVFTTLVIHLAQAHSFHNSRRSHLNRLPVRDPGDWTSLGCYTDNPASRTLGLAAYQSGTAMTVGSCISFCDSAGYIYAGLEYAQECFCGNSLALGEEADSADCNMACTGNSAETCGAGLRLNVYWSGAQPPAGPSTPAQVGDWVSLGCYSDNVNGGRTLTVGVAPAGGVSIESCTTACGAAGYTLAGAEYSNECYCGNSFQNGGAPADASGCNMVCGANSAQYCGGPNRLNVYSLNGTIPTDPGDGGSDGTGGGVGPFSNGDGQWEAAGCYSDNVAARTLIHPVAGGGSLTLQSCTTACYNAGYPIAGAEYSVECYCGTEFSNGGSLQATSDCNMPCAGDSTQKCGGPNRLTVYQFTGTLPTNPPGGGGGGGGGGNVSPVTDGLPGTWEYAACYVDNAFGRIFPHQLPDNNDLTVESCIDSCNGLGYTLAGVEYSVQCFCGNTLINGAVVGQESECNMGCGGANAEACGGPNRLSVYTSTGDVAALPVPTVLTTNLPGSWQYVGCLKEPGAERVFPYEILLGDEGTIETCLAQCAKFGYSAGGMEFGNECWCGDLADVENNSPGLGAETDCAIPCSGDPIHLCGGAERLQYYTWDGTMNVWHTPANKGHYEFLIGGVVVPLVVTLGINNKISMVEKFGTSQFANSTGAYELDLSLTNDFEHAWREMHVTSDVFCSASIILPDRAGRQLNIGGWSYESTKGVRFYTPDGSPGVNGTNDWEENYQELHLQRQRWYPTALVLANGSILVVGGELGSNGAPEPSLEILPKPGGGETWMYLDYLERTDPNNLYPYLWVLPSGGIFIAYYNEARILDPVSFETIKILPNIPGSVTSPLAGRTYPLEGAAMSLPQYPPYTDPLTILICGGSNFGIALDNCVSIQPDVENPEWTIERMPSRRVMPCMAALPDGTFLILNGAEQGVAGFGLADFPNLNAVLYDPTQPVGQRFSVLGDTIVPRMYHSEATLLYDGRVLVSGSDPQTYYPDGSEKFPEEMRIEVYVPPYLTDGRTQPSFTITNTDWAYGGTYSITVTLHHGDTSTMRVSLIAATSSTHGNTMGGRTIFPAFTCSGNTCTITAPPNANISPPGWHQLFVLDGPTPSYSAWVRIGGDPGHLGEWPNYPGFTLPGM